jgi:hypothetical protein
MRESFDKKKGQIGPLALSIHTHHNPVAKAVAPRGQNHVPARPSTWTMLFPHGKALLRRAQDTQVERSGEREGAR